MSYINPAELQELKKVIENLTIQLEEAKLVVKQWNDASAQLSQNAAEARAKNQNVGYGIGGVLFGSKYRAAVRREASASNASIAKQVAEKRGQILKGKTEAQERVRKIQLDLKLTKLEYQKLLALEKEQNKDKLTKTKASTQSIDLLQKLKEAYDLGLLTDEEYEEKRKKYASDI
ncbi:MAG: SHOCT domain-containing protein [Anaerolineaceae bacterium]